jgi:hypothetical protein
VHYFKVRIAPAPAARFDAWHRTQRRPEAAALLPTAAHHSGLSMVREHMNAHSITALFNESAGFGSTSHTSPCSSHVHICTERRVPVSIAVSLHLLHDTCAMLDA